MNKFISLILIVFLSFGLAINEAAAKRFGGGRSFGVQRSHSSLFSGRNYAKPGVTQRTNSNRWGGVLGGLLVGGLLASLFMGHGLANGILTWLILGAALLFLISIFRRKLQPGMQTGQSKANLFNNFSQYSATGANASNSDFTELPAGFVPEQFLRQAKVTFIRLQTAYDQKNLQDLQSFTAPEVFAEIKMQLDERGDEWNKTEVIDLDAQLLNVAKQAYSTVASVRFTGTIKENNDSATPLDEIWHFSQFSDKQEWVVVGLQQEVYQP